MPVQIHIKTGAGLKKLEKGLREHPQTVFPHLLKAAQFSAFKVERESKKLTPVDTGLLRATIATSIGINKIGAIVQTNTKYAIYVHEGTKRMQKRPFMEQGAKLSESTIQKVYRVEITKALEKLK